MFKGIPKMLCMAGVDTLHQRVLFIFHGVYAAPSIIFELMVVWKCDHSSCENQSACPSPMITAHVGVFLHMHIVKQSDQAGGRLIHNVHVWPDGRER